MASRVISNISVLQCLGDRDPHATVFGLVGVVEVVDHLSHEVDAEASRAPLFDPGVDRWYLGGGGIEGFDVGVDQLEMELIILALKSIVFEYLYLPAIRRSH